MQKEFISAFQITKLIIFEVEYYTLGSNTTPYFSTQANQFCRSKRDWSICGQAQAELLPKHSKARKFWEKWDSYHLHKLTDEKLEELLADLEELKKHYNYLYRERPQDGSFWVSHFMYDDLVQFSKQEPKTKC